VKFGGTVIEKVISSRGVARDRATAVAAVELRGARVQQLQVIVDLGHRADRAARCPHRIGLVDRDRRRNAVDPVDLGPVHPIEELASVRRERLDVAPLALGEQRVEDERTLARAGNAGDDDQFAGRQVEVDVLEIVLPRAANADRCRRRQRRSVVHGFATWTGRCRPGSVAQSSRCARATGSGARDGAARLGHRGMLDQRSAQPGIDRVGLERYVAERTDPDFHRVRAGADRYRQVRRRHLRLVAGGREAVAQRRQRAQQLLLAAGHAADLDLDLARIGTHG
jgi:hypothetical protein